MLRSAVLLLMVSLVSGPVAWAGEVTVAVTGRNGKPLAEAVVALIPDSPAALWSNAVGPPIAAVVDQRHETFIPLVTLLRQGGALRFRNSDTTQHHVYSFSTIKQFQFLLNPGDQSPPVIFDRPGIAAIGCNIHDHMIAYVYAARSPWTALSDAGGHVRLDAVPTGPSHLEVWHPGLAGDAKPLTQQVDIGAAPQNVGVVLDVSTAAMPMHDPHHSMDY